MGDSVRDPAIYLPKKCSGCGKTKRRQDFPVDRSARDGLRSACRTCTNARREVERDNIAAKQHAAYLARKESDPDAQKRRHMEVKAEFEAALKDGHVLIDQSVVDRLMSRLDSDTKTCRLCIREKPLTEFYIRIRNGRTLEVRPTCKPCHNRETVEGRKHVSPTAAFHRYRQSALKKGLHFRLDLKFVELALSSPCSYCGDTDILMTLDRVDSAMGYSVENCVPCCIRCNLVKADMPVSAWKILAPAMREARVRGAFGDWVGRNHFPSKALSK